MHCWTFFLFFGGLIDDRFIIIALVIGEFVGHDVAIGLMIRVDSIVHSLQKVQVGALFVMLLCVCDGILCFTLC